MEVVCLKVDFLISGLFWLGEIKRIKIVIICCRFCIVRSSLRSSFVSWSKWVEIELSKIVILGLWVSLGDEIAKLAKRIILSFLISTDFFFFESEFGLSNQILKILVVDSHLKFIDVVRCAWYSETMSIDDVWEIKVVVEDTKWNNLYSFSL